jgi:hypothetical protein
MEGSGCGLILKVYYPGVLLDGLRKPTRNLGQDRRSLGGDLNPEPPKYEGVLNTGLRRLVFPQ